MPANGEMWIPSDRELELREVNARLREALKFAASVIKSGEAWSVQCESIIGGALGQAALTAAFSICDGWRTIDSAPKDIPILIWVKNELGPSEPTVARFELEYDLPLDDATERMRFVERGGFYNIRATHWMPLPAAPSTGEET